MGISDSRASKESSQRSRSFHLIVQIVVLLSLIAVVGIGCDEIFGPKGPDSIPGKDRGLSVFELKAQATEPTWDILMRNPDQYKSKLIWMRGEVSQVLSFDDDAYQMTVAVTPRGTGYWSDEVWLLYAVDRGPRLLKDDIVRFAGIFKDIGELKNVLGGRSQHPEISVIVAN